MQPSGLQAQHYLGDLPEIQSILASSATSGDVHGDYCLEGISVIWIVIHPGTFVFGGEKRTDFAQSTAFGLQVAHQDAAILSGVRSQSGTQRNREGLRVRQGS